MYGLYRNPVVVKELRVRMRGGRAFLVLTGYLTILSGAAGLILLLFISAQDTAPSLDARQSLGKSIFWVVAAIQLLTVCFIGPALTAGAISSEREQRTFDLVRTTLLSARTLIYGKLLTATSFLYLLLLTSLPIQSLALLFGGIAPEEVLIAVLVLLVSGLAFSAIGLVLSTYARRSLVATVMSYAVTLIIVFGIPMFLVIAATSLEAISPRFLDNANALVQYIVVGVAWFLVAANPLAAGVVTELILIEEQSVFYFSLPLGNGLQFPFVSPWIGFLILYMVLSVILIEVAVRRVKRPDR